MPWRWGRRVLGVVVTLVALVALLTGAVAGGARLVSRAVSDESGPSMATPPAGTYYHGVYPGGRSGWEDDLTPADLDAYEAAAGREAAWVYFSHN